MKRLSVVLALLSCLVGGLVVASPASATAAPCSNGQVSLTFDSGPVKGISDGVLDVLARYKVKATFFVLGRRIADAPELVTRMYAEGHTVANHSWSHKDFTTLTDDQIRDEVRTTQGALVEAGAHPIALVRPPSGRVDTRVGAAIESAGMHWTTWTVSSNDWDATSVDQVVANTVSRVRPFHTNTILLHDGNPNSGLTLRALPTIIDRLRAGGYCFTTLTSWGNPAYAVPQVAGTATAGKERRRVPARIVLTLDRPTSRRVPVTLWTSNGTATSGRDFRPVRTTVWAKPGQRRLLVEVPVLDDARRESPEWFQLNLRPDPRIKLSATSVKGWIVSND